ncbi:MAG: DUF192 domain-containing protein [Candidatus Dojkabacteria bacterium]|nr:DUF192 domain-containing protein [Candidatus Dojkabacteria bacterium]MDQ7020430.1 DUF192 domain-containing protein [Candidatus Dojkabacteria bacterium]
MIKILIPILALTIAIAIPVLSKDNITQYKDGNFINVSFEQKETPKLTLEIALSPNKRQEGLMYRKELDKNSGMIFIFEKDQPLTFWMKNTLLSLDIMYINSEYEIVKIYSSTKTNQTSELYPSIVLSMYVIEVNSGWAEDNKIEVGDIINISR